MKGFGFLTSPGITSVLAIVLAGTLIGLVTATILYSTLYSTHTLQVIVAVSLVVTGSLGLLWQLTLSVLRRRWSIDLLSPLVYFPILYSLFYGLGSLIYAKGEQITIPTNQYILYFVGLFAYFAGTLAALTFPLPRRSTLNFKIAWSRNRLKYAILGLFAIGAISFAYIVSRTGLPVLSASVETIRIQVVQQVGGYISYLRNSIEIAIVLLFAYGFTRSKANLKDPRWIALLLFALLALASSGARRKVAVPLMVGIILYNYLRKRLGLTSFLAVGIVVFLLFSLAGSLRHIGAFQLDQAGITRIMYNEGARGAQALYRVSEVFPSQVDFFGWRGALMAFTALLPGRQELITSILKEEVFGLKFGGGGWVPTILGWFYVNFGGPGIYIGMPLVGFFIGALYRKMLRNKDEFSTILYSYVAIYYIVALRSGFIEIWPMYVIGVFYIVNAYCRIRYRPRCQFLT